MREPNEEEKEIAQDILRRALNGGLLREIAAGLAKYGDKRERECGQNQAGKSTELQVNEIMGHISNCDYGMAGLKAKILWDKLIKEAPDE